MKPRKRGQLWTARWTRADGTEGTQNGFLIEKEADLYGQEQRIIEKKKRLAGIFERMTKKELTFYEYVSTSYSEGLTVKDRTMDDYEVNLNKHILPRFGKFPLSAITPEEIEKWGQALMAMRMPDGTKYSYRTLEKLENQLATILKKAVKNDYLLKNPFGKVDRTRFKKRIVKKRVQVLEYDILVKTAAAMPAHLEFLIWLGYFTGARPSEILGLTWDRIDFNKKTIRIDRQIHFSSAEVFDDELKSAAAYRTISLNEVLEEKLLAHRKAFGLGPNQLLFKNRDGNVLRYKTALYSFVNATRPLGIPVGVGLHILRHTCVSTMVRAGIDIKMVQEWVGHSSIEETLNTYSHFFKEDKMVAASKMVTYFRALAEKDELKVRLLA